MHIYVYIYMHTVYNYTSILYSYIDLYFNARPYIDLYFNARLLIGFHIYFISGGYSPRQPVSLAECIHTTVALAIVAKSQPKSFSLISSEVRVYLVA